MVANQSPSYTDVIIEPKNLNDYPLNAPLMQVVSTLDNGKGSGENITVYEDNNERGTNTSMCTFSIQGLSTAELVHMD